MQWHNDMAMSPSENTLKSSTRSLSASGKSIGATESNRDLALQNDFDLEAKKAFAKRELSVSIKNAPIVLGTTTTMSLGTLITPVLGDEAAIPIAGVATVVSSGIAIVENVTRNELTGTGIISQGYVEAQSFIKNKADQTFDRLSDLVSHVFEAKKEPSKEEEEEATLRKLGEMLEAAQRARQQEALDEARDRELNQLDKAREDELAKLKDLQKEGRDIKKARKKQDGGS